MSCRLLNRLVLVLALSLSLCPAASAATSSWSQVLELLEGIGLGSAGPVIQAKAGSEINRDGQSPWLKRARRSSQKPTDGMAKRGCEIDPDGHTVCTP